MIYLELSTSDEKNYIERLYKSFATGKDFELFLNHFLKKIGFQEVVTTKYVGDNGIDLTCSRPGIDLQGIDTMNYYVQAKRYKPTNKVQAKEIRDLKGSTKRDKQGNVLNNNYIKALLRILCKHTLTVQESEFISWRVSRKTAYTPQLHFSGNNGACQGRLSEQPFILPLI